MAARTLRPKHQDEIRQKIQASQLVNRLTDCALGKVELRADQLKSIEILLRKSLADLSSIELKGPNDGPIFIAEIPQLVGAEEWARAKK